MSVHLHRAGRADRLAADLAEVLAVPLADPFGTEIVSVPTRGVERWLAQTLSRRLGRSEVNRDNRREDTGKGSESGRADGVCAGVAFWSPRRLMAQVSAAVIGSEPGDDPWLASRLVWPLLAVLTEAEHEAWAAPVWTYLRRASTDTSRRFSTARHAAELIEHYLAIRPQMIEHWRQGRDVDALGEPLPPSLAWQAEAFRRLLGRLPVPDPAARLDQITRLLDASAEAVDLPERLSVFGPTRMPPDQLQILTALGRHRDVHLWLPHPSEALWRNVAGRLGSRHGTGLGPRADDPTADVARHRLLAYLGRDVRELQLVLAAGGVGDSEPADDHARDQLDDQGEALPLLARLQSDIAEDRPLTALPPRPALQPDDDSISVHACHGPDRQVEVLRELLLDLLEDDPSLEPRDIVVMCPDIETFAPLISAGFGVESEDPDRSHPGHRLRVRLADRSLRQLNPLLAVLGRLFDLATARVEASTVLDLCASDPVATKFGFSEDDILRLRDLVTKSGVRWGLDVADRRRFAMDQFAQNTWAAGLDRMLLGVTMDEEGEHYLGTTLPLDDVDAGDVDLIGRLAEVVTRIRDFLDELDHGRSLHAWVRLCRDTLDALTEAAPGESWQTAQAYSELARLTEAEDLDPTNAISRAEIRAVLSEAFRGRPSRANFRTGTLTMCTMMPMRSVPHRVVCLLGLDDGVFPRGGGADGDDITARVAMVGDRDRRSEDRQLMLDAIMAAGEKLIIVYSGADPRTNADRPPSVPVGELLDVLDLSATTADGRPVRRQVVRRHPLQPFDPRNFDPGTERTPFSFDRAGLDGARALVRARAELGEEAPPPAPLDVEVSPFELPDLVDLGDLVRFFNHPIRAFLKHRAGMYVLDEDQPDPEELPISLDSLQAWSVGERLLSLNLAGVDPDRAVAAEWRRGSLPPRQLGVRAITPVAREVAEVVRNAEPWLRGTRDQREANVTVEVAGRSVQVVGSVSDLVDSRIVRVSYSRLGAKHRMRSWLELLALTAGHPDVPWQAVTVGRPAQSVLGPVDPAVARLVLADLVDVYRTGLSGPIPLPVKLSAEYARIRSNGASVQTMRRRLAEDWQTKELDEPFGMFYPAERGLAALEAEPSIRSEERGGTGEPTRFGTLARRVWQPLIGAEDLR